MVTVPDATHIRRDSPLLGEAWFASDGAPRVTAHIAGLAYLLTIIAGAFEEIIRSRLVVAGDGAAMLHGLTHFEWLYRLAFAANIVPVYSVVTLLLYVLLKPVNRGLSLLAAFVSLSGIAVGSFNGVFYLAPVLATTEPSLVSAFTREQVQAIAAFALRLHEQGFNICLVFFGIYCMLVGGLFAASALLPRAVSGLLAVSGLAYLAHSLFAFVSPTLASGLAPYALACGAFGECLFAIWLLVRGVNSRKWWELYRAPGEAAHELYPEANRRPG